MQEQMFFSESNNDTLYYTFGGTTPDDIIDYFCRAADDFEYIKLNKNKTNSTISIFDSVEFRIRINSRTQCLDTENPLAIEYVSQIPGASLTKGVAHFPLLTTQDALPTIKEMVQCIYAELKSKAGGRMFGCCNSYVQCSDAGYCLHLKDREYWGCCYRKNLEAGRIFYGKNKNI